METLVVCTDGRTVWKGIMTRELKRDENIDLGNATYRVVTVKVESGVQTILVSQRLTHRQG